MSGRVMKPIRRRMRDERYLRRKADRSIVTAVSRLERSLKYGYANYSQLDVGERFLIEGARGLKAYWMAPGGEMTRSTINKETLEPGIDHLYFCVDQRIEELRSKQAWRNLTDLAHSSLKSEVVERMQRIREQAGGKWLLSSPDPSLHLAVWPVRAYAEIERDERRFTVGAILPVAAVCIPKNRHPMEAS